MISRQALPLLLEDLRSFPAVAILGPRQVGKTTLALQVAEAAGRPSLYLDLERPSDRALLANPVEGLEGRAGVLVILDEVQRLPGLFEALRVVIDARRRAGEPHGQFLLLGSASRELLRQSSESLAGRIAYRELTPFRPDEETGQPLDRLWLRGGFPESTLAADDAASLAWRQAFLRTYLERDLPQLGVRVPAETMRRFWTMLAHLQGSLLNASQLAGSLAVSGKTITHYLDLCVDLLLVRRLAPWHANVGKRLTRSPKVYLRDSGLVHALLGLATQDELLSHPIAGPSWEGFVLSSLAAAAAGWTPWFYRTQAGAEIDLLLERARKLWAFEVKRSTAPVVSRGFHLACDDLGVERRFVVHPGTHRYRTSGGVEALGVLDAMAEVRSSG